MSPTSTVMERLAMLCDGTSQAAVARKLEISDVQLSRFVRGKRSLTLKFMARLYRTYPDIFSDLRAVATANMPPDPTEGD